MRLFLTVLMFAGLLSSSAQVAFPIAAGTAAISGNPGVYGVVTNVTTSTAALAVTIDAGSTPYNLLLFHFNHHNSGALRTVSSVKFGSQNASFVTNTTYFDSFGKSEVYVLGGASAGSGTATVTLNAAPTEFSLIVYAITNATSAISTFSTNTGSTTVSGLTNTVTTVANELTLNCFLAGGTGIILTPGAAETKRDGDVVPGVNTHTSVGASQTASGASTTISFAINASNPCTQIAVSVRNQ